MITALIDVIALLSHHEFYGFSFQVLVLELHRCINQVNAFTEWSQHKLSNLLKPLVPHSLFKGF